MTQLIFLLQKAASKAGGDRYESETAAKEAFVIYVPQSISRKDGKPADQLIVEIK